MRLRWRLLAGMLLALSIAGCNSFSGLFTGSHSDTSPSSTLTQSQAEEAAKSFLHVALDSPCQTQVETVSWIEANMGFSNVSRISSSDPVYVVKVTSSGAIPGLSGAGDDSDERKASRTGIVAVHATKGSILAANY